MVYNLTYRRPPHVASPRDSLSGHEKQKSITESITSSNSASNHGIPEALSFDKIIAGGTCPPCTIRDFLNYLKYVEYSAENLQFYLWFRDYTSRFDKLPRNEQALSPEWTKAQAEIAEAGATAASHRVSGHGVDPNIAHMLKDTEFADVKSTSHAHKVDPFITPDKTPSLDEKRDVLSEYGSSTGDEKTLASSTAHRYMAENAFEDAGLKWKPFTTQPYRDEINRVISNYIRKGGPRELNLSDRERSAVLRALQNTTHPSALQPVANAAEYALRRQAHPNFIRWTICNGNRPRVVFARGLGISGIFLGFLADLLITLSHAGRAWRVLPFIGWFIGISTLIAAWKGMCVVLHGMHHRHLRPWELFEEESDEVLDEKSTSFESLMSESTNSFEDEPWIARYQKRNVVRKIFDREVWIQEPALRGIQDTIFLQAILGSFVVSAIVVGVFCAVPKGNLY